MKRYVTWNEVEDYVRRVCDKFSDKKLTGVYGIPRGGLVFATMLSHRLNISLLQAPCKGCLVVDDISDTGKTLIHFRECGYLISTMFYKKDSLVEPDYWYANKYNDWIVYPWEDKNESSRNI